MSVPLAHRPAETIDGTAETAWVHIDSKLSTFE
jgi:hypothetical protein